MKKKFNSVLEMVREMSEDKSLAADFEKRIAAKTLVKKLFTLRQIKGLSQQEMAKKLGWSQSRVSKLESAEDSDLRFGDIIAWLAVLDLELGIIISPREASAVSKVKHHAFAIKRVTDQLADMAAGDNAITKGVAQFFGEAAFNLVSMLQQSAKKLPLSADESPFQIEIEVVGEETDTSTEREPITKKRRKKAIA